jgi:hypothetical protein
MNTTTRRSFLATALLAGVGAVAAAGCGRRLPQVALTDAADLASGALLEMLLGPPPDRATVLTAPPDPPLLRKGVYESVLIAADRDAFAAVSKGSLKTADIEAIQKRVVGDVDKVLKRRGFSAQEAPSFPPQVPADARMMLVATLTPVTEQGGSPAERASGKAAVLVLVRLAVTDPATGQTLRARDFYSGRDVAGTGSAATRPRDY